MRLATSIALSAFVASTSAQSVATYSIVHAVDSPAGVMTFEVYGWAERESIGDRSGIHGVNLSVEISGGTVEVGSIRSNHEVFGGTNIRVDDAGFDISFASNGFTGHNFSSGLALLTFEVRQATESQIVLRTGQGELSLFGAAIGVPGPFATPIAYDVVNHAQMTIAVPGVGTLAGVAGGILLAGRRARRSAALG